MKIFIDNKLISKDLISYNHGLNFNRFFNDSEIVTYELEVTKSYFLDKLTLFYNTVRDEIKKDDEKHKDTSDFTKVNYCSFSELLQHSKQLKEIFETYLKDNFFKDFINTKATYIINSIDVIEVARTIKIKGKALKI